MGSRRAYPFTSVLNMLTLTNTIIEWLLFRNNNFPNPLKFRSLFNGTKSEPICAGSTVSKHEYETLLNDLLLTISYKGPERATDPAMTDAVIKQLLADGASPKLVERMATRGPVEVGVAMGTASYPHLSWKQQEAIAVYSTIVATVDGYATELYPDLRSFGTNLLLGKPQSHEVLQLLTTWLARHCKEDYTGFGGDMIIKASTDFICTNYFEAQATGLLGAMESPRAAVYLRNKCGDSEVFAHFIFPEKDFPEERYLESYFPAIPYLIEYLDHINDVMSFYKEELVGERNNFVHIFARSENISVSESLKETFKRSVDSFKTIQAILSRDEDKRLVEAGVRFLHGYITFHILSIRYRLAALDVPAIKEAITSVADPGKPPAAQNETTVDEVKD